MMRIALVDDDTMFLRDLSGLVASLPDWGESRPEIRAFASAEDFWPAFEQAPFDLVFLDVIMPGASGLETAHRLYAADPRVVLAFISSSPDFARQGYGVDAVAYLIKPVDRRAVHQLVEQALQRRTRRLNRRLLLKTGRTTNQIKLDEVIYLESDNKRVNFHYRDEVSVYIGKLEDFLSQLPPNFLQVHKSYAVNLDHIRALRPQEMVADNGRIIPISRRFRSQTEERYLAHVAAEAWR